MAEIITSEELKKRLDKGTIPFIFDLRAEDEFQGWRIEGRGEVDTLNIPQEDFVGEEERHFGRFPKDKQILTVCAHGDSAEYSANLLAEQGFKTIALQGGMDAWSELYESHVVSESPLIYQVYRVAKGCMSHVVIDGGEAVVIDAVRHTKHITDILDRHNAKAVAVIDTHLQADHISGGREIAAKYDAPYWISARDSAGSSYAHELLKNGCGFRAGGVAMKALHTPGHTPGSVSIVMDGRFIFTGDTVMGKSIGRPDLGGLADKWARYLYYTLHKRIAPMPDAITVLPTHAASIREQDGDGIVKLTLGKSRAEQQLFQMKDLAKFTDVIKATLLENPARYADIRKYNLGVLDADEKKLKELEIGKNLCGMAAKK